MDDGPVEAVGDRRARGTAGLVVRPQHEVVNEELRATSEQIGERCLAAVRVEGVLLVDAHPRELSPLPRELVAAPRVLLLGGQELTPGGQPLLARALPVHASAPRAASS